MNDDRTPKDVSRYHRWYKTDKSDAMGSTNIHRGFSDDTMFAAMTTQPNIAAMNITHCKDNLRLKGCKQYIQRWTYAIPLEIIYLTPLSKWNPHGLKYHGNHMEGNRRYGSCDSTLKRELNGTNSKRFYQIPDAFFKGKTLDRSKADTSRYHACVLDPNGKSHRVRASGIHVMLPHIQDVGLVRQRYPIFPVNGEGTSVWKELNALRDIYMNPKEYPRMMWDKQDSDFINSQPVDFDFILSKPKHSDHTHRLTLSKQELIEIKGGKQVYKTTSTENEHFHVLTVRWSQKLNAFYYHRCDNKYRCFDSHPRILIEKNNS